jgi:hypothetical protein
MQQGGPIGAEASRVALMAALATSQGKCKDGHLPEQAKAFFHPSVDIDAQKLACNIGGDTVSALASPERSTAKVLADTADRAVAEAIGLDPSRCFRYTTPALVAIGCFDPGNKSAAFPYTLIALRETQSDTPTKPPKSE